jgi:hypothetical protein
MMESYQTDFANFAVGFLKKETGGLAKNESGVVRPTGVVRSMKKTPTEMLHCFRTSAAIIARYSCISLTLFSPNTKSRGCDDFFRTKIQQTIPNRTPFIFISPQLRKPNKYCNLLICEQDTDLFSTVVVNPLNF